MSKLSTVNSIWVSSQAGAPMERRGMVRVSDTGIEGDRYAEGRGHFQVVGSENRRLAVRHVSIIATEAFYIAKQRSGMGWALPETRRNVVLNDIMPEALNELVGEEFRLGSVGLRGVELCTPCPRPGQLIGREGFRIAFEGIAGIRAEVVNPGILHGNDALLLGDNR